MSEMDKNTPAVPYTESLKQRKRVNLVEDVPLPGPLLVHIEPTNLCNFKCTCCPESLPTFKEISGGNFYLSVDDFNIVANELSTVSTIKGINFFAMGEPLANKNLIQFVSIAKSKNLSDHYMLSSNGALLRQEKYRGLCESGLDFLRISIFGSNEEMHRSVTQSKVPLSKIRDNVAEFRKFRISNGFEKPMVTVKMIDSGNARHNEEFLQYFSDIGDEIILEPLTNWNDSNEKDFSRQFASYAGDLLETNHYRRKKEVCPFPFYSLIIHSDLNVSVCCVDWEKKLVIGNLKQNSLLEIWNGERLRKIQLMHVQRRKDELDGCRNCAYIHTAIDNIDVLDEKTFLSRFG